jgi:hypothetical protein
MWRPPPTQSPPRQSLDVTSLHQSVQRLSESHDQALSTLVPHKGLLVVFFKGGPAAATLQQLMLPNLLQQQQLGPVVAVEATVEALLAAFFKRPPAAATLQQLMLPTLLKHQLCPVVAVEATVEALLAVFLNGPLWTLKCGICCKWCLQRQVAVALTVLATTTTAKC